VTRKIGISLNGDDVRLITNNLVCCMNPDDIEKAIHAGVAKAVEQQLPCYLRSRSDKGQWKIDGLRRDVKPSSKPTRPSPGAARLIFWIGGAIIGKAPFMVAVQQIYAIGLSHITLR